MISKKYGIKPDPSKDQHFLTNPDIIRKIISLSEIKQKDRVLEIGAGVGTLTEHLAKTKAKIIAVEMDRGFKKVLRKLKFKNLEIVYENILGVIDTLDFNKVVSNTPYSICEPLLNKLFGRDFSLAVLSIPEKFYRRISSKPGEELYSLLTLKTNVFFKVTFKFRIPREDFSPVPKTETAVVLLKPLSKKDYEKTPERFVFKEIFLQGKKKLKNSLAEAIINLNKKILSKDFTKKMSKEVIKNMRLDKELLKKMTKEMRLEDFERLKEKFTPFS
ncbi:MAG: 16S rRNA (adenine(1518)-N(6)/adenine(1519)-N(6))-dimethyltransferase [Candidatus Aenigmatarchaeota archaeon]|nr:MAG: 16S rRNA (adenine(1518)-N(6)/adenine(1519)-N(6))-dimethyltransferase [Candidatus Aenigmarchaeota archaeon]